MQLQTPVEIPQAACLRASSRVFMMGSCFADEMTARMQACGIPVCSNPFGVQYNPMSIAACVRRLLSNVEFTEEELVYHGGLYHSFMHHGDFSGADKNAVLRKVNDSLKHGSEALQNADVIIFTLGTAWVYEHNGKVVGNCHKIASSNFLRRRLSVKEITATFNDLLSDPVFANKKLIFNISPIRHKKDGMHENQLSKAVLLLAVEELQKRNNCIYFPSYEIVLDELRDYRFYAQDMVHPSDLAVHYVWERFVDCFFPKEEQLIMRKIAAVNALLQHRPLHTDTPEYVAFIEQTERKVKQLKADYPWAVLSAQR